MLANSSSLERKIRIRSEQPSFPAYFHQSRRGKKCSSNHITNHILFSIDGHHPIRFLCRKIRYLVQPRKYTKTKQIAWWQTCFKITFPCFFFNGYSNRLDIFSGLKTNQLPRLTVLYFIPCSVPCKTKHYLPFVRFATHSPPKPCADNR